MALDQGGFANWLGWLKSAQHEPNIILSNNDMALINLFRKGEEALLTVARQDPLVQGEPEPLVRFLGFGDSSIDFQLDVWLYDPMLMFSAKSNLYYKIWDAFAEHNIEIPFPQRDLHLRSGVP